LEEKLRKESKLEKKHSHEDRSIQASSKLKGRSSWHTGVHQTSQEQERTTQQGESEDEEEEDETQEATQPLRRSTRVRKLNPKYANAALVEDIKEPNTYEEACKPKEWIEASEERSKL
jgi:hypothetical protein